MNIIKFKNETMLAYQDYLLSFVCDEYQTRYFSRLLSMLMEVPFEPTNVGLDSNRALDGLALREHYAKIYKIDISKLGTKCSVLEMMIALAIRCEQEYMSDNELGDRTNRWFWYMIRSMGLLGMDDGRMEDEQAYSIIQNMLYRRYERDGRGGLFYVKNCQRDLREDEIWTQMNQYLISIEK